MVHHDSRVNQSEMVEGFDVFFFFMRSGKGSGKQPMQKRPCVFVVGCQYKTILVHCDTYLLIYL